MNFCFFMAAPAGGAPQQGSLLLSMLPMVGILAVLYLIMIRPQKKKEKQLREEINAMQVGDEVVTIGGIVGKIVNMQGDEITIATSVANSLLTFKKNAINHVIKSGNARPAPVKESSDVAAQVAEDEKPKGFFEKIFKNPKAE